MNKAKQRGKKGKEQGVYQMLYAVEIALRIGEKDAKLLTANF